MTLYPHRLSAGTGGFACTICREEYNLSPWEKRTGLDGFIYDLWQCLNCHAILNASHLREARINASFVDMQSDSSDEFYAIDQAFLDSVPAAIAQIDFIRFLFEQYPACPRGVAIDFGAGRGLVAGAAAVHFERVYAAELTLNVLQKVHEVMPNRHRIAVTNDFMAIPDSFDLIVSMHTLEHLPNLRDILDGLIAKLNPKGALFFQVPLLRKDHLVCVHFTFFTETSCRAMAHELGLQMVGTWFDTQNDFLTCIMRKP